MSAIVRNILIFMRHLFTILPNSVCLTVIMPPSIFITEA